ncbi:MAG: PilN domain-containing protein [Prevotellaceae bacterium]|jgi:Tfp pilus assembly protein PilN|nr:PilN domain-containing protein [Prevotellaceae bacterium]
MKIIQKILNQVHILLVTLNDADNLSACLVKYKNGKFISQHENFDITSVETSKEQIPVVVLLKGYGIITKNCDTNKDIISRVTGDENIFLWNFDYKGHISFVRIEQVEKFLKKIEKGQNKIIGIECLSNDADEQTLENRITQIIKEKFSTRNIVKPSTYSSRLTMMLFNKIKLPFLMLILIILIANTFISQNLSNAYSENNTKLLTLQKQHGQISNITQQKRQAIAGYSKNLPIKIAFACDRIAIVTPEPITLSELSVQPLAKPFETGKEPKLNENRIYISGYTHNYENISEYISNLEKEKFIKKLTLTSVTQDNKTNIFNFKINIDIK